MVYAVNAEELLSQDESDRALLSAIRKDAKHAAEVRRLKSEHGALMRALEATQDQLAAALEMDRTFAPKAIPMPDKGQDSEATAIVLASDWHVGARINPKVVNGLNKFNPDIARKRSAAFFHNALRLVRKERQNVRVPNLVLWLGGDLISNDIHPELAESNYLSPTQEVVFAQELLSDGLKFLAENGEFERIIIPCSTGNHGRTTEKIRVSTEYRNSYEHLLYWQLAAKFKEPIYDWMIEDGYYTYLKLYGKTHRFSHGHFVRYQGGVGGLTVPLMKAIKRANDQKVADHDHIGHFHQLTRHGRFTVNGSLCGFDAYALSIGASPERPQQAFDLFDSKRGFTISAPILLD